MNIESWTTTKAHPHGTPPEVHGWIRDLLQGCAAEVGVPPQAIVKVIIVDSTDYGAAIKSIAAEEQWTDNKSATGIAKTIPIIDAVGVRSAVVMLAGLFADAPGFELMRRYVLCHEFGHCKDNWLRGLSDSPCLSSSGEFRVQSVAAYYNHILLSEFAACAHASTALDGEVLNWEKDHTDFVPGMLATVNEKRRTYAGEPQGFRDLAFMASGAFWTMLIQFAKLLGSRVAHPEMRPHVPGEWATNGRIIDNLFDRERLILETLWKSYPAWERAMSSELFALWHVLAECQGYRFVESARGDMMFLQ